jgi:hypothetical protein
MNDRTEPPPPPSSPSLQPKGVGPNELLAHILTHLTVKLVTPRQAASLFSSSGRIIESMVTALGLTPNTWTVPLLREGWDEGLQIPIPFPEPPPVAVQAVAVAAARAAAARAADGGAMLRVVNGRIVKPRSSSGAVHFGGGVLQADAPFETAVDVQRRNSPPDYIHIKQNVWMSAQRPKRVVCSFCLVADSSNFTLKLKIFNRMCFQQNLLTLPGLFGSIVYRRRLPRDEIQVCNCRVQPLGDEQTGPAIQSSRASRGSAAAAAAAAAALQLAGPDTCTGDVDAGVVVNEVMEFMVASVEAALAKPTAEVPSTGISHPRAASAGVAAAIAAAAAGEDGSAPQVGRGRGRPSLAISRPSAATDPALRDGCGDNCLNRLSYFHCDPRVCPCGERCANRPFHQLPSPPMEVFLTRDRGWGVRAAAPISAGVFLVEYAGEVIDEEEMRARMEEARRLREPHFYMMEAEPGVVIDARRRGNLARLLNSSCDPNCVTHKWHDAATGEVRVGIFTLRDVTMGEELVYDYQFQQVGMKLQKCKYGLQTCIIHHTYIYIITQDCFLWEVPACASLTRVPPQQQPLSMYPGGGGCRCWRVRLPLRRPKLPRQHGRAGA